MIGANATAAETLSLARVGQASELFALCGDDRTNLDIALQACALRAPSDSPDGRLVCHVHLSDTTFRDVLLEHEIMQVFSDRAELRYVNSDDNCARLLFSQLHLDLLPGDGPVHLVLFGFGHLGQCIALQAARVCHFAGGHRLQITVVDADPSEGNLFQSRFPGFSEVCQVRYLKWAGTLRSLQSSERLDSEGWSRRMAVVVAMERDEQNLAVALDMASSGRDVRMPVYVRLSGGDAILRLASAASGRLASRGLHPFGSVEEVWSREIFQREQLDAVARHIHDSYREKRLRSGEAATGIRALAEWQFLTEDFKRANRAQADHIEVKMRGIGCKVVPLSEGISSFEFSAEELDTLSRMEHFRWSADRLLAGWTYAAVRNDADKHHPSLIPWEALSESEREKDREAVRTIPELLQAMGKGVSRES